MYFACRVCLTIAFICGSMFLLAGRAYSQIQFNTNPNLNYSPAVAPCESAISAKVQTDHDVLAHFDDNTKVQKDMAGETRVGGWGDYFSGMEDTRFTFACVFDEHNKTITSAFYTVYQVGSERLIAPQNQAQDCQEKVVAKIYAKEGLGSSTNPKSIVSKTKKNGDRIIYGDTTWIGTISKFRFACTYRDDRLITFDYWHLPGPRAFHNNY